MHWVEKLADEVIKEFKERKTIVCNGGLSVSGLQHVGRLRGEITIAHAVKRILKEKGFDAIQTLVLYDMDPWKGKEAQLRQFKKPEEAKQYIGWPLYLVPDPYGCCKNWTEHFWHDFGDYLEEFAGQVKIVTTRELYLNNERMKNFIKECIKHRREIIRVLNKYRKRKPLPTDWIPFEPICEECNRIDTTRTLSVDLDKEKVIYKCQNCGYEGTTSLTNGKLAWRLEWVGVWYALNVSFEPYGKDHAMPGGSRDSCNDLAINVFHFKPPVGTPYEWVGYVSRGKDLGDMGSSDFIGFTPREWLEVAEAEVLKYYYLVNPPMKRLVLSLERVPFYTDHYDRAERIYYGIEKVEDKDLEENIKKSYLLAQLKTPPKEFPFQISYLHCVALVQTLPSEGDLLEEAIKRLKITGKLKRELNDFEKERLKRRLLCARKWLEIYAPSHYKISVLNELTDDVISKLNKNILNLMEKLYENLKEAEWTDESIKQAMVKIPKKKGKEEKEFFRNLYLIFFGKEYGPRIAPYLSMLDKKWVLERLKEAIRKLK